MMANEGITMDSHMEWYLETGVSNYMCGHKHLLVYIQQIKDERVFQRLNEGPN